MKAIEGQKNGIITKNGKIFEEQLELLEKVSQERDNQIYITKKFRQSKNLKIKE